MTAGEMAALVASRLTNYELEQFTVSFCSYEFGDAIELLDAQRNPHLYVCETDELIASETELQVGDARVSPVCSDEHVTQKQKKVEL